MTDRNPHPFDEFDEAVRALGRTVWTELEPSLERIAAWIARKMEKKP